MFTYFKLKERGTNVKTEFVAGLTTFLTMVYIVVVNPVILSNAGVPFQTVFTATIIASVAGTLWMAIFANYPIAVAPGLGMNAYFVTIVTTQGISYTTAFSAVFLSGIIFILLSLTSMREKLINAIPANLKAGITAGIGLFIAFIGFRMTGIITASESSLVTLGNLHSTTAALAVFGLVISLILMCLRIHGYLFWGMLITGAAAYLLGELSFDKIVAFPELPTLVISNPITAVQDIFTYSLYTAVFSFLLITLFDTTGTMIAVAKRAGLVKDNKLPKAESALMADAVGTSLGAILGTTPTSAYLESSSGVMAGGRTGLTAIFVALFFVISAFFLPLIMSVSSVSAITAPSLIIVGSFMISAVKEIDWDEIDEAFPAFLIILAMPMTSSISTGLAFGFISYPIMKVFSGKWRELNMMNVAIAIAFLLLMVFVPH